MTENKIHIQSPDPSERDWEYDGDGTRIYKVEAGYGTKTPYKDEYEEWKELLGHEWHEKPEYEKSKKKKYIGIEEPYYVGLP